jgi:hypothetical protein
MIPVVLTINYESYTLLREVTLRESFMLKKLNGKGSKSALISYNLVVAAMFERHFRNEYTKTQFVTTKLTLQVYEVQALYNCLVCTQDLRCEVLLALERELSNWRATGTKDDPFREWYEQTNVKQVYGPYEELSDLSLIHI